MESKARLLSSLVMSAFCFQCVTSKAGIPITPEKSVLMECKYVSRSRTLVESDVECVLQNNGASSAKVRFEKLAVNDPETSLVPIDVTRNPNYEAFQTVVVILGIIVVLGAIVLLASKSNYIGNVHVGVPDSPLPGRTITKPANSPVFASVDSFEIPPFRSVVLAFKIKHRARRPATLSIQLDDVSGETLIVPIQEPLKMGGKVSDFDY